MSIQPSDIQIFLSNNSASSGGTISNTQLVDATLNNLFPDTTGNQAATGFVLYRKVFIYNNNPTLTLTSAVVWISAEPQSQEIIAIGLSVSHDDQDGTAITYSSPTTQSLALNLGNIAPAASVGLWIRRTTPQGAVSFPISTTQIQIQGNTM